jgi:exopolysaccharide biosynthesis polyprenyl glycosylphosphotransferase
MLKRHARLVSSGLFASDLLVTVGAFLLSYAFLRINPVGWSFGRLAELDQYFWLLLPITVIWTFFLRTAGLYESRRTVSLGREFAQLAGAVLLCSLTFLTFLALTKSSHISRFFICFFLILDFVSLALVRLGVRRLARWARALGHNTRTILIVGTGPGAQGQASEILRNSHWGYRLLGFVSDGSAGRPLEPLGHSILGSIRDIRRILCEYVVDEVIIAVPADRIALLNNVFLECEQVGVKARLALDFFPHQIAQMEMDSFGGSPTLSFTTTPKEDWTFVTKRAMDIVGSGLFLIAFSWLYGLIALLIKATSKGPVFYTQTRVGRYGRHFNFYKFRSMVVDADQKRAALDHLNEMDGPVFKIKNDPRVTRIGHLLRKFSLDELPQMWNVLKGDMSLVGPRPPIPSEVVKYDSWVRRRLSIRPGITCLWQVTGRNSINFQQWMELDLRYIDNWSLLLDLEILLKTVPAVLAGKGAS